MYDFTEIYENPILEYKSLLLFLSLSAINAKYYMNETNDMDIFEY